MKHFTNALLSKMTLLFTRSFISSNSTDRIALQPDTQNGSSKAVLHEHNLLKISQLLYRASVGFALLGLSFWSGSGASPSGIDGNFNETSTHQLQQNPLSDAFFKDFEPNSFMQTAQATTNQELILAEVLDYIQWLQNVDDLGISSEMRVLKYKNLILAATLVSATLEEKTEQQKWSGTAIEFSQIARKTMDEALSGSGNETHEHLEEINTRRLIAMALNYYQQGTVSLADLASQYQVIDKNFLVKSGFCRYKILRALERDGIIQLPDFSIAKYI